MAKLPLKLLLYALYAGAAALFGGIGWTFYETYQLQQRAGTPAYQTQIIKDMDDLLRAGRELQPERKVWRYGTPWWQQFAKANITGKVEVVKTEEAPPEETKKPEDSGIKVADMVVLEAVMCLVKPAEQAGNNQPAAAEKPAGTEEKPDDQAGTKPAAGAPEPAAAEAQARKRREVTHVVLRYKPEVNVQPPPDAVPAPATAAPRAFTPGDTARPPQPGTTPPPPPPLATGQAGELRQIVCLEETLWPPYDHIRLVRVAEDAQSAFFQREDPKKDRGLWPPPEEVPKGVLDLDAQVVMTLLGGQRRESNGFATQATPLAAAPAPSTWIDPPVTGEVTPGNVHVSRKDIERFQVESDRILNEDVAVRHYKARVGNYEGLQIERVSGPLARFGVQEGDVLLSINGEKVKSKAQAYNIGRRQYDAGTRRFVVEILSGRGTGIETRTITLPDR